MPTIFSQRVYAYPLIGALQGLLLYLSVEQVGDSHPLAAQTAVQFLILFPNLLFLAWPKTGFAKAVGFAAGLSVFFAALTWWLGTRSGVADPDAMFTAPGWIVAIGLSLMALPFFQARFETEVDSTRYEVLHGLAWHNVFAIILGWVFVGAVWLMLALLMGLFGLINMTFLEDLLEEGAVAATVTFASFGAGMGVILALPRIVAASHALAFALLRVLAPVLAGAVILFLVLLPFTGLAPLWETRSAATLLLAIVAGAFLLTNAVMQDEPGTPDFPRPALNIVVLQMLVLPAFAALAFYAMWLRVDQYGLTPDRIYGLAVATIALLVTLAYALVMAVRRRQGWNALRQTNLYLLAPIALIALALISPIADPLRLSAQAQAERLRAGKVSAADFDFGVLRFKLGKAGQAALAELRADTNLPDRTIIDERLAVLDAADSYHGWAGDVGLATKLSYGNESWRDADTQPIMVRPANTPLPAGFWDFMQADDNHDANMCFRLGEARCAFIVADIFPGDMLEVVLVSEQPGRNQVLFRAYIHDDVDGWKHFYEHFEWAENPADHAPLWQAIEDGAFQLSAPNFNLLQVGQGLTLFTPDETWHPRSTNPRPEPKLVPVPSN
ncbi:MAG: DUF4153 domain-containing protein [Alphaproteobacteria bacterium]